MPLTRHLYEKDEVFSALQTCLRSYHGYTSRALFWTWELVVSEEPATALNTIRATWLAHGGCHDPTLMSVQPATPKDWVTLVLRANEAIHTAHGTSTHHFLSTTATTPARPHRTRDTSRRLPPPQVTAAMSGEALEPADGAAWWSALDAAVRIAARTDAFWLLQAAQPSLSSDTIWTALHAINPDMSPIIQLLQTNIDQFDPTQQATAQGTALLLLCATPAERALMLQTYVCPQEYSYCKDWQTWSETIGRRAARRYPIPPEALHTGTTRGSMSSRYTNIGEVRDPVPELGEGCMFWRKALLLYRIEIDDDSDALAFPDDDTIEAFYAAYFPDDIPDEWSAADQQKSHGRGCAETAPPPPFTPVREEPLDYDVWAAGIAQ